MVFLIVEYIVSYDLHLSNHLKFMKYIEIQKWKKK